MEIESTTSQLASLDVDGWQLESADVRHAATQGKFWIPDIEDRASLNLGQDAKLLFQILVVAEDDSTELAVERMWVEVTGRVGGLYVGELRNQPISVDPGQGIDFGMIVRFRPEHVIDIGVS
jgi:hypothetical protein